MDYDISALSKKEMTELIRQNADKPDEELLHAAREIRDQEYGRRVFVRGLIEATSYCKNDCYYCGIRRGNEKARRYRLTQEEIFACCAEGYRLGFRTFVLQGGEDPWFTDTRLCDIVSQIRQDYPECAITLSLGERSKDSYRALYDAGANRYLLRHETANGAHYGKLHPPELSLKDRKSCLYTLRETGFQVGAGFMVGSPYQKYDYLADDLLFLKELQPHMVGIGPFIPHKDSIFKDEPAGQLSLVLTMLALTRILLPTVLLPATTALGTIRGDGREQGLSAGANVVMPNLSPVGVRKDYALYDGKICTGEEAAQCLDCLRARIENAGYALDLSRGDHLSMAC